MKHHCLKTCVFASLYILSTVMIAQATTWYVAPTGNDSATGRTPANAFATIQKAVDVANPGDTVRLADGVYFQDVKTAASGTATAPILITGGSNAIIKGGGDNRIIAYHRDQRRLSHARRLYHRWRIRPRPLS